MRGQEPLLPPSLEELELLLTVEPLLCALGVAAPVELDAVEPDVDVAPVVDVDVEPVVVVDAPLAA